MRSLISFKKATVPVVAERKKGSCTVLRERKMLRCTVLRLFGKNLWQERVESMWPWGREGARVLPRLFQNMPRTSVLKLRKTEGCQKLQTRQVWVGGDVSKTLGGGSSLKGISGTPDSMSLAYDEWVALVAITLHCGRFAGRFISEPPREWVSQCQDIRESTPLSEVSNLWIWKGLRDPESDQSDIWMSAEYPFKLWVKQANYCVMVWRIVLGLIHGDHSGQLSAPIHYGASGNILHE